MGRNTFSVDPCVVTYTVAQTDNSLFTIDADYGLIGEKWLSHTDDVPTILGTEAIQYTGWQVDAAFSSHPSIGGAQIMSKTFAVTITPACSYS